MPRVIVGTTPVRLTLDIDPPSPHAIVSGGESLVLQNTNPDPVYLGGEAVSTSSYGYELRSSETFSIDLLAGEHLYAVAAAETTINLFRPGD